MSISQWLAITGLVIILGLAAYAFVLWRRIWQTRRSRHSQEAQRNDRLAGDIEFLARSVLDGRCPVTEGAIRIKVLLDNYSGPRRADLDLQVFETIYESTAHIPTHQAWKDLSESQRKLHLRQMETLELHHKEAVENAARQLSKGLAP